MAITAAQSGPVATHEVGIQDLEQQAREFRIPEFLPPWSHGLNPATTEAQDATDAWVRAQFRTLSLAGTERLAKIVASGINTWLTPSAYSSASAWGLEFAMEYILFLFVMDDEVLDTTASTALAQIFLELQLVMMSSFPRDEVLEEGLERILAVDEKWALAKRAKIDEFLACALKRPGTVDYSDESTKDESPLTSAFRDLWKRATSAMPEDWNRRFAHITQRDLFAMFREAEERNLGSPPDSISEYIRKRREFGFVESTLIVGELVDGIHVSNEMYYSAPLQRLIQAANDAIVWHNDIQSFQKIVFREVAAKIIVQKKSDNRNLIIVTRTLQELLAGETNLVDLISKSKGCSYNRAAEIVTDMLVDRCKDLSVAAAELRHHAHFRKEPFLDKEAAEKYILQCSNFLSASHDFHHRSDRFREKMWAAKTV